MATVKPVIRQFACIVISLNIYNHFNVCHYIIMVEIQSLRLYNESVVTVNCKIVLFVAQHGFSVAIYFLQQTISNSDDSN